ncbi:MAG: hypothetical protein ACYCYO_19960 [Bacilli bacterium]
MSSVFRRVRRKDKRIARWRPDTKRSVQIQIRKYTVNGSAMNIVDAERPVSEERDFGAVRRKTRLQWEMPWSDLSNDFDLARFRLVNPNASAPVSQLQAYSHSPRPYMHLKI